MSEPHDILPHSAGNGGKAMLSEAMLLQYLEGKLPAEQQHEVEQWLADEGMESDAMEGLQALRPEDTKHSVNKLNRTLGKTLRGKKNRRKPLKTDQYTLVAIGVLLLLAIAAWLVIHRAI